MNQRYILQHSEHLPDGWVLTDTETGLVCRFRQHQFNETQQFTFLDEDTEVMKGRSPQEIAQIVNDLAQWGSTFHYNILMSPVRMSTRRQIGREIAWHRQRQGLSQRQLAEASGVNHTNIAKIELGRYNVSLDILDRILQALGLHLALENKE